jgi:hypothetical protein
LVSLASQQSARFADTLSRCWELGQTRRPRNLKRFRKLRKEVCGPSASKTVQRTGASRSAQKTKRMSSAAGSRS